MAKTFEHILVPYNGTGGSQKAFRKAVSMASSIQAKITVLTCLEERPTFAMFKSKTRKDEWEKEKKTVQKQQSEMEKFASENGVTCNSKIIRGKRLASIEIVSFAEQHDVDLIMMSKTKFSSHLEKMHYHSTLENVFRNAQCAILVLN